MSTTAEERTHPTDTGRQYAPALADARQPAATARTAKTGLKQQETMSEGQGLGS
jgi:hypothetical protein